MPGIDPRRLLALARADLLERARRPAFLVTLGVGLWAAWLFSPPNGSAYATLQFSEHRGSYGSGWLGGATAILTTVFFSIAGFYIVKNAIAGDRTSGVGQVLAATPMRNVEYLLGKWLANSALLGTMVAVIALGSAGMQIVRGEDPHVRPLVLAAPFVFVTLPALALVSALAVVFEAVPLLSGGLGNVAFFFLWITFFVGGDSPGTRAAGWDPLGIHTLLLQMQRACMDAFPDVRAHPDRYSVGLNFKQSGHWNVTTFAWPGVHWTQALLLPRLGWLMAAGLLASLGALPFDRFSGEGLPRRTRRGRNAASAGETAEPEASRGDAAPAAIEPEVARFSIATLPAIRRRFDALTLVLAELRLTFARTSWAWWSAWLLLQLPGIFAPREIAARFAALPWIWPVLHWSALGARDRVHGTTALLDASPRPIARQLFAAWCAGVLPALVAGAGFGLRSLAHGEPGVVAGWLAGAAFVPALALALGTLTSGRKTFEVVFVVLWYLGPLNGGAFVDFGGGSGAVAAPGFALAAAVLLAAAALGRERRFASA